MTYARQDHQRVVELRKRDHAKAREQELRQAAQAEIPIKDVTGSEAWDYFLSLLQAEVAKIDNALDSLQESTATDFDYDHASLARNKALTQQLMVQKETLAQVIALPKQIIDQGEKAKIVLRDYLEE